MGPGLGHRPDGVAVETTIHVQNASASRSVIALYEICFDWGCIVWVHHDATCRAIGVCSREEEPWSDYVTTPAPFSPQGLSHDNLWATFPVLLRFDNGNPGLENWAFEHKTLLGLLVATR